MKNIMLYKLLLSLFSFVVAFGISGCKGEFEAESPAVPSTGGMTTGNDKVILYSIGSPSMGDFGPNIQAECESELPAISAPGFVADISRVAPFISDGSLNIVDRLPIQEQGKPIYDPSGMNKIQDSWSALWSSGVMMDLGSAGVIPPASFWWSGSTSMGMLSADNCDGWIDNTSFFGTSGDADAVTSFWVEDSSPMCSATNYKICMAW